MISIILNQLNVIEFSLFHIKSRKKMRWLRKMFVEIVEVN